MSARRLRLAAAALAAGLSIALPVYAEGGGLDISALGWTAASVYVQPQKADVLAAVGLRGGLVLDGWAMDAWAFASPSRATRTGRA